MVVLTPFAPATTVLPSALTATAEPSQSLFALAATERSALGAPLVAQPPLGLV